MRRHVIAAALVMLTVILLTYSNAMHAVPAQDDFHSIFDNPAVHSLSNIPRFFTNAKLFSTLPQNTTWRPMLSGLYALSWAAGGGSPVAFLVVALLLVLGQAALFARLWRRLRGGR